MTKRWRREEKATGLMRVTQGYRNWEYGTNEETFITIRRVYEELPNGEMAYLFTVSFHMKGVMPKRLAKRFLDVEDAKLAGREWYEKNIEKF